MQPKLSIRSEKRTNVRFHEGGDPIKAWSKRRVGWNRRFAKAGQRLFRWLAGGLSRLAPCAATRLAEKVFLTPHRHRPPAHEMSWLADAHEFTVPFGSRRLQAFLWGEGPRTALLVHGWAGRGSQLGALVAPLASEGFRVVAFDAPGHGRSPGKTSSLPEMAEAVAAVLRDLGGADVVVAHSLGAAATTAALAGYPGLDSDLEVGALAFLAAPSDVTDFARRFSHLTGLSMPVVHEMRRRIERRFGIEWQELNVARLAPRVSRPLWLAHCVDDREVPAEHSRRTAAAWPGARYYETEGLGHRRILRDGPTIRRLVEFVTEYAVRRHTAADGPSGADGGAENRAENRADASADGSDSPDWPVRGRVRSLDAFDAAATGYE